MNKELFLTQYFSKLNSDDIDYFVYGEYGCLPKDTGGSDIDILIVQKDLPRALHELKEMITLNNIALSSYYESTTNKFVRLITKDWGVQIDFLGGGFVWKTLEYYNLEYLRSNIILHNGIKVLDIKAGYYLDFFKEVIHIANVKDKYLDGFIAEYKSNANRKNEIKSIYGQEVLDIIERNLEHEQLRKAIPELSSLMRKVISKNNFFARIKYFISKLSRMAKCPGYVISVQGTDGSGKSTIINAITPWLDECFHHGIIYNHLRPNVFPELGVLLGKKEKTDKPVVVTDPHAQKPSGFIGSIVRWGYYMLDYTFGYMKAVMPVIRTKSKVFIFDRYYYDYYVDQHRSRTSLSQWILRFGECFVPTPDLILCLGGDPKKIYERKPETSLEEVARQTEVLKEFCKKRKKAIWIDTTLPPEESVRLTKEAIVNMLSKRFKHTEL